MIIDITEFDCIALAFFLEFESLGQQFHTFSTIWLILLVVRCARLEGQCGVHLRTLLAALPPSGLVHHTTTNIFQGQRQGFRPKYSIKLSRCRLCAWESLRRKTLSL